MSISQEEGRNDLPIVPISQSCTRIVVRWESSQGLKSRELSSLEALHFWHMCHRDVFVHTLHYRCLDVSGQAGTFVYEGVNTDDDGRWVCMIIENAKNAIDDLFKALSERERNIRPKVKPRAHRRTALAT